MLEMQTDKDADGERASQLPLSCYALHTPSTLEGGLGSLNVNHLHPESCAPAAARSLFFSVSPDACTNPTLYWLGSLLRDRRPVEEAGCSAFSDAPLGQSSAELKGSAPPPSKGEATESLRRSPRPESAAPCCAFDLELASGPFLLDFGDCLYAPNILKDPQVGASHFHTSLGAPGIERGFLDQPPILLPPVLLSQPPSPTDQLWVDFSGQDDSHCVDARKAQGRLLQLRWLPFAAEGAVARPRRSRTSPLPGQVGVVWGSVGLVFFCVVGDVPH